MKDLLFFCLLAVLLMSAATAFVSGGYTLRGMVRQMRRCVGLRAGMLVHNAITTGRHECGGLALRSDAAISTRYLLGKVGSDAQHVAVVAAASDKPIGIMADEAEAAEALVNVQLLGSLEGTQIMVAGGDITAFADVYSDGAGKVVVEPSAAGTYWWVGRAVEAGSDGLEIEVIPRLPQKVVVVANGASLATTQAAMTGGAIVKVLGS